jgi:hypothetical protein
LYFFILFQDFSNHLPGLLHQSLMLLLELLGNLLLLDLAILYLLFQQLYELLVHHLRIRVVLFVTDVQNSEDGLAVLSKLTLQLPQVRHCSELNAVLQVLFLHPQQVPDAPSDDLCRPSREGDQICISKQRCYGWGEGDGPGESQE